jgi:hypothetical protein
MREDFRITLSLKLEQLTEKVTIKAHGVFIWVRIVVDELVKGVRDGTAFSLLEEKVSDMPEELGDLYRHTLERVEFDYAQEAYIMLQIALCSLAPLPLRTFMFCVSLIRHGKVYKSSEEEMLRQLASRSGGLLEIIETFRESTETGTSNEIPNGSSKIIVTSYPDEYEDVWEDLDDEDFRTTIAVQFIHQTVRDFTAKSRNHLGLRLDDTNFVCETGHLYLLESAVKFGWRRWAQELTRSMFEYAFLAEADSVSNVGRIRNIFHQMQMSSTGNELGAGAILSLQSWIYRELPQYQQSLGNVSPRIQLLALAAAADLKEVVTSEFESNSSSGSFPDSFPDSLPNSSIDFALILQMATVGQRLSSSSASRESMVTVLLGILVKRGLNVDNIEFVLPNLFKETEYVDFPYQIEGTPLAWILRHVILPHKHVSHEEALSIASLLLENGASPNTMAISDTRSPRRTLLLDCILHYDVEAVKLLLLYEADPSVVDRKVAFALWITEQIQQETAMSTLLKENQISLWETGQDISLNEFTVLHTAPLGLFGMLYGRLGKISP